MAGSLLTRCAHQCLLAGGVGSVRVYLYEVNSEGTYSAGPLFVWTDPQGPGHVICLEDVFADEFVTWAAGKTLFEGKYDVQKQFIPAVTFILNSGWEFNRSYYAGAAYIYFFIKENGRVYAD